VERWRGVTKTGRAELLLLDVTAASTDNGRPEKSPRVDDRQRRRIEDRNARWGAKGLKEMLPPGGKIDSPGDGAAVLTRVAAGIREPGALLPCCELRRR
jgi:hypothetical protein